MLGLKLPTDPRWAALARDPEQLKDLLTDHAWCEQKAASNAISLIVIYPERTELVVEMTRVAQEEMMHFGMVVEKLKDRGWALGHERKDPYVNDLLQFTRKSGSRAEKLVDRLLFAAMIEARSCERFDLLSRELMDTDLRHFYTELMKSEAEHYTTFLAFARNYGERKAVDQRWQEFVEFEAGVIASYGTGATVHG